MSSARKPQVLVVNQYSSPEELYAAVKKQGVENTAVVFPSSVDSVKKEDALLSRYQANNPTKTTAMHRTVDVLAELGIATLGFPVDGMGEVADPSTDIDEDSFQAVEDAYRALGFGKDLLVVAPKDNKSANPWRPAGKENKRLANHYLEELELLKLFAADDEAGQKDPKKKYKVKLAETVVLKAGTPNPEDEKGAALTQDTPFTHLPRTVSKRNRAAFFDGKKNLAAKVSLRDDWFQELAPKTLFNVRYADLHQKQQAALSSKRNWSIFWGVLGALFTLGIGTYFAYRSYQDFKAEHAKTALVKDEQTPIEFMNLTQFRRILSASGPHSKVARKIFSLEDTHKSIPAAVNDPAKADEKAAFYYDPEQYKSTLWAKAQMDSKRDVTAKPMDQTERDQLDANRNASIALAPKLV